MGKKCAICGNESLPLFGFPTHPEKCKMWLNLIQQHSGQKIVITEFKNISKRKFICHVHFEDWCFTSTIRKRLIPGARPFTKVCPILLLKSNSVEQIQRPVTREQIAPKKDSSMCHPEILPDSRIGAVSSGCSGHPQLTPKSQEINRSLALCEEVRLDVARLLNITESETISSVKEKFSPVMFSKSSNENMPIASFPVSKSKLVNNLFEIIQNIVAGTATLSMKTLNETHVEWKIELPSNSSVFTVQCELRSDENERMQIITDEYKVVNVSSGTVDNTNIIKHENNITFGESRGHSSPLYNLKQEIPELLLVLKSEEEVEDKNNKEDQIKPASPEISSIKSMSHFMKKVNESNNFSNGRKLIDVTASDSNLMSLLTEEEKYGNGDDDRQKKSSEDTENNNGIGTNKGQAFERKSVKEQHQRFHATEKPCISGMEGKTLTYSHNPVGHKTVHMVRCSTCLKCGKSFSHANNIYCHRRIHRYNSLMKETVVTLHSLGVLACDVHPLDLLISTADAPPNLADIVNTKYKSLRSGPIYSMHHAVMLEFLVSKLNSSHQRILNIFKKYPRIRLRSFHSIKQMLKILIEDVGLSKEKIESNGFLLCLNSREVSSLVESLPSLLIDINVTEFIKKTPVILSVQVENMKKIVKLFQQYDITPQHIMKKGNIFTLHPDTVSERLKILEETPELKEMKSNPRYLLLVYLYNKVLERMECLKKIDLRITLAVLCDSEARFQNYISTPEDRLLRTEIEEHLSTRFNVKKTLIHDKIDHYHIDAKVMSVDKINERINFLEENNVPKEDILKNLSVLLLSEQDLLKNIQEEALASSPLELNFENHSDVHMQNAVLQAFLNFMKNQQKYGQRSIDEQLDVDEFVNKL